MLTICVPIYNFNSTKLVEKLIDQTKLTNSPTEIILIDDCSDNNFNIDKYALDNNIKFIRLEKNIGRAAIRNMFLKFANFNYLLFLDCDSLIIKPDFLQKYIDTIKKHPNSVICGGRIYNKNKPKRANLLRWKYGVKKESKPQHIRAKSPHASFMTNNFTVKKSILNSVKFNENLTQYGHEDTLFGFELKKRKIDIIHIDNPILNGDLETNKNYLKNTENAIKNLTLLLEYTRYNPNLIEDITLLKTYYKLKPFQPVFNGIFMLCKSVIKHYLEKGGSMLFIFNFYKLGILSNMLVSDKNTEQKNI